MTDLIPYLSRVTSQRQSTLTSRGDVSESGVSPALCRRSREDSNLRPDGIVFGLIGVGMIYAALRLRSFRRVE